MDKVLIGKCLKKARMRAGLTQTALARAIGMDIAAYNLVENDRAEPRTRTVVALARALGCSSDYLLGLVDAGEDDTP